LMFCVELSRGDEEREKEKCADQKRFHKPHGVVHFGRDVAHSVYRHLTFVSSVNIFYNKRTP
jgi:hypothetical protein